MKNLLCPGALVLVLCSGARPPVVEDHIPPVSSSMPGMVDRWDRAQIRHSWLGRVDKVVRRISNHEKRYKSISAKCGVPWQVVASLHNMESGGRFTRHLHEGSSLKGRTRYIPKGRPINGDPPFTWEESAYDALYTLKRLDRVKWSDLGVCLYTCEKYNGLGYLRYHKDVNSPYMFSGTNLYTSGKYVADGRWSQSAVSKQVGVVPILIKLVYADHPAK